ncbi:heparinase II/III domain-containing protein [Sunxiuqinia indica]|uniref:heparinase II/III domain-containing protein n=1 Tax=Sunxiuqinia indica TaxID=2692584 RepID=UPI00135A213D|nr:heparinase II/III family protein [Sunxiuqinia indica]
MTKLSVGKCESFSRFYILYILFFTLLTFSVNAQIPGFSKFKNQPFERPSHLPQFTASDFIINVDRMSLYPDGFMFGDNQTLKELFDFLLKEPNGQKFWIEEATKVATILNKWDFDTSGFGGDRYFWSARQLKDLSLVYLLTGHAALGQFIHSHVMKITGMPYEFWLNAELRGYDHDHPVGGLETSMLCNTFSVVLSAAGGLFSSEEKEQIDDALYNKGLIPCLNWFEKPYKSNWMAVMCNGTFVASKYLNNKEGTSVAVKYLKKYLNDLIDSDGSYGEGTSYFDFPIRSLLPTIIVMENEKEPDVFSVSGLRYSSKWLAYHYLFSPDKDGQTLPNVVDFGDNGSMGNSSFSGPTKNTTNLILAMMYNDGLASWLINKFGGSLNLLDRLLLYSYHNKRGLPKPKSPEKEKLPLIKAFDSGNCFIRSSWDDNSIVMAMWSGGHGKTGLTHRRPEVSSICMGAYGEYLIVSPASASYRSPLHYLWDATTHAANTITIDDKNQLFPGKGSSIWVKTDNSDFWEQGLPKSELVECKEGRIADILVNEAAQAYHVPMKYVRRSIIYVRDPGYFVIVDKIEARSSSHKYSWRLHLNNRDEQGSLKEIGDGHWQFTRPLAGLDISLFADTEIETEIGEGYLHGPIRDYSPEEKNEGKLGSSIELEAYNLQNSQSLTYYAVIFPTKDGISAPEIEYENNCITVNREVLSFKEGECTINQKGRIETFKLW